MSTIQGASSIAAPADNDARREALTDRSHGLIVEAGAGSGKTAILAGRVALLLADGVEPSSIAAITFTELAAAELANRVREYAEELALGRVPPTIASAFPAGEPSTKQRAASARALESIDELTCSTIHTFARELVRPYPVEADTDPGAGVLDPAQQRLLFNDVMEEWLRQILGEGQDELAEPGVVAQLVASEGGISREELDKMAHFLHERPDAVSPPQADIADVALRVAHATNDYYDLICGAPTEAAALVQGVDQLPDLIKQLLQIARTRGAAQCAFAAVALHRPDPLFTQKGTPRIPKVKGKWVALMQEAGLGKSEATDSFEQFNQAFLAFSGALALLGPAAINTLVLYVSEELREVGQRYQQRKRAAAALDFDDLIATALNLLRNHPDIRDELADRYQHVLIDEFQDTDPAQAEIVWRLTGEPNGGDWRTWSSRPGARFVVGDPKQSIYRFRGADINTYQQLTGTATDNTRQLSLNTNFRSAPGILDCVNASFAEPLALQGQPGYLPLNAWNDPTAVTNVQFLSVPSPNGAEERVGAGDARESEAEVVATLVADLIAGKSTLVGRRLAPGEIALLAPVGSGLELYERALDERGIDVTSQAGKGFYRRQEVQDLVALTRALADPRDRLALGALLRGPLIGATDEELLDATYALSHLEGNERYLNVFTDPTLIEPGPIRTALTRLAPLAHERFATTPHALLSRAIDALEVRAVLEHRHDSHADRALANVDRFLEHSQAFNVRGITEFCWHVWAAWENSESELEGRADSSRDSVTLITIHSAKGLEWPVVIPVNTSSRTPAPKGLLYSRHQGEFATRLFKQATSNYEAVKEAEQLELEREQVRLWYVAATRAKEILIIPKHEGKTDQSAWCNLVAWRPEDLPVINVAPNKEHEMAPPATGQEAQTPEQFQEEQRMLEASLRRVERRAPSRREDQTLDVLAAGETGLDAPVEPRLTEEEAARILESFDDTVNAPETAPGVMAVGAARGILLHKLMEEIINGEVDAEADALAYRAVDLADQLPPLLDAAAIDPTEVAASALRAWALPDVAALHGRLLAEVEVTGVDEHESAGSTTIWGGIADAIAISEDGAPEVVIDWKSDRHLPDERVEHYRQQLLAYLKLTGAGKGLLVLATTGQVIHVNPD